ncbi:ABC transporter permease [Clostridium sp. KNHs205]|uniref:ABC transporter permease n=1 Tax=Clostridium sp. KNHs205 TaxID=1449050 RepID=UPI00051B61B6|nr:ABC transporter permease [Clostridium sp. KNHs205]
MFKYVIHKILNKKWMAASLILGNLLLIGMVSGSVVYSNAVLNRLLVKELNNAMETTGVYPLQTAVEIRMDRTRSDVSVAGKVKELEYLTDSLPSNMQLKAREIIRNYYIRTNYLYAPEEKEVNSQVLDLSFLSGMEDHVTMLSGKTYSSQLVDGAIEVIVSRKAMMEQELMLGEELYLADARDKEGNPYKIRITGVFQNSESEDVYWVKSPDAYSKQFFMDEDLFRELFVNYEAPQYKWNSIFYVLMDYSDIKSGQVGNMSSVLERFSEKVIAMDCYSYKEYFGELLKDFQVKEVRLNNILFLLEIPIFILLLVFIYMVNKQMMLNERGDIAMLKSRGASGGHIIRIYLYQGIIFSVLGLLLGIPLGLFFCYSLGNSNAFLEFVSRTALKVDFTGKAFLASLLCGGISLVITLVLAFWHTGETIVSYKRKLNKKAGKPVLKSLVAGAVFLSIAGYSLYNFKLHADTLAAGKGLDPLLFCGAIFFILGMAFLVQGLFPFMTEVIFCAGKNFWNPAAYASFQKLNKASDNQGFILLFLILTVSLGIFDATLARTINGNEEDRIVYTTGADLVLQEKWVSNKEDIQAYVAALKAMGQNVDESQFTVVYTEPDFDRYKELEGVEKVTKVLMDKGLQVNGNSGKINTTLMGIQTKGFGETVNFKDGLLQTHWYNYLNEMGASEDGILVSSNFRDMLGYKTGDTITCSGEDGSFTGIIKGFVDYWPSYAPVTLEKSKDGKAAEVNQFLIVANLSKVQKEWGITPYQIWIKTSGSSSFIYNFAGQNNLQFEVFKDLSANIIEKNNDPFYQGTNGILTLGFIIILLICAIGFLIFWILSIFTRTLQFGVLRAMGMTLGEIIGMLVQEQLFLSVLPIFFGILIGRLVSGLFVPLIQIAYTSSEQILPLEIMEQGSDRIRVLVIVAAVVLLCMLIIGKLISDMKVTKALKLGED